MERGTKGGNIFSQTHPMEANNKEFPQNVSMTSTVFQPPPREGVKWKCSDSCNHNLPICHTDKHVNTLRQVQDDSMHCNYFNNNCTSFFHESATSSKTDMLVPSCSNCITRKELFVESDAKNPARNSHEDSLNPSILYGTITKENSLEYCMNEQMSFICNEKEQLLQSEKVFALIDDSTIANTYKEAPEEQNKNSNNFFQMYTTPETIMKQDYNKKQPKFDKDQVYVDHAVPDFSTSGSPNSFIVSNVPQNESFEQICMLNTAVSYMCENEIQKIFIKTGDTAEMSQDIHSILPPATINACNVTPRQANSIGDSPNVNPCYKVNELELDACHYFPEDMEKLIYEINTRLGNIPPSSTLNYVSQICETAKEYCEKYHHSAPISGNAFKNLLALFLQVAYSWVASYESVKDIDHFHSDLKNHLMKWKNSSEALLNVLIFAINNWNFLIDCNQLGTRDSNQIVTCKPLIYRPLPNTDSTSHTLSGRMSLPNCKDCQYIAESTNECLVNGLCKDTASNKDKAYQRNNSCTTANNESKYSFSNSSVNTFHYGNSDSKHIATGSTNNTESENVPHSSEFLEAQPVLDKKHKNFDTKFPRSFSYNFKNRESLNDSKSFVTCKNTKTNSEEKLAEVGTGSSDNVNILHKQDGSTSLCKKFGTSNFNIRHPGILPIACLERTNTMSNFDYKEYKDRENTYEHRSENRYSDEHQKLKNKLSQQPVCSGRITSAAKKQMKRPLSKVEKKRTKNFDHYQNCDSDTSEAYEYIRPGSYRVPMKHSAEMHRKGQGLLNSSFKWDSADNKKVLNEFETCFSKNANRAADMPHKTDSKVQLNDTLHHKSISRGDNVMEKTGKVKSSMTNYPKHLSNGKRQSVYWNKSEHQQPRCHSYYNARQKEKFCRKRTESRDRNMPVRSLNSAAMNAFEDQIPVVKTSQNFSGIKKCKLETDTFPET